MESNHRQTKYAVFALSLSFLLILNGIALFAQDIASLENNIIGGTNVFGTRKAPQTHIRKTVTVQRTATVARVRQHAVKQYSKKDLGKPIPSGPRTNPLEVAKILVNLGNFRYNEGKYAEALEVYKSAVSVASQYVPAYIGMADAYQALGANDKALETIQKAVNLDPKSPDVQFSLGVMFYEHEKYNESIAALQKAATLAPKDGKIYHYQGFVYRRLKQDADAKAAFEKAIANYKAAVKANTEDAASYVGLGQAYDALERNDDALDAYAKAVEIEPQLPQAQTRLGALYYEKERYNEALKTLQKAVELAPDNADANYFLGLAHYKLSQDNEAVAVLKKAIELQYGYAEAYYALGNVYDRQGLLNDAVKAYSDAIAHRLDYAEAYYDLGVVYYNMKKYADAISNYKEAARFKPGIEVYKNIGDAYMQQNSDVVNASIYYKKATEQKSNDDQEVAESFGNLGFCYYKMKRWADSIAAFQRATQLRRNAEDFLYLGVVSNIIKKYDEAIKNLTEASTLDPKDPTIFYQLGIAWLRSANFPNAESSFKKAIELKKDFISAFIGLGMAYEGQKNWNKAMDIYKEAIKLKQDYGLAHLQLGTLYLTMGKKKDAENELKILQTIDPRLAQELRNRINFSNFRSK